MKLQTKVWVLIAAFTLGCLSGRLINAADVDADVSTRETLVGLPVILSIQITNAIDHTTPEFPEVDGLEIEKAGPPSRSTQVSIINGRRTERSKIVYSFRITPTREGTFTIPPVRVTADGVTRITKVVRIVATKGDTNDLLFVEVEGNQDEIFVGQPLDLKLKIWIRPFRDEQTSYRLSEGEMWSQISEQSNWGNFQSVFDEMDANRRRPGGTSVLRTDSGGNEREYYLYEVQTTVYPDRPGQIDGGNVRVLINYPQRLGRSRSPFSALEDDFFGDSNPFEDSFFSDSIFGGRSLRIVESKPMVGEATVNPILVKPVPTSGRPDDYRGAVGRYSIITEATPTAVKAGDPITLRIGITGSGPLDVVRAPPIEAQTDLIRDFKVPDEPLAGFVDRDRKVFTTSIRPKHDGVTEIPGIRFSYFDPDQEKFVTVTSDPIPIEVDQAEMLALDSIVGRSSASTSGQRDVTSSGNAAAERSEQTDQWAFPILRADAAMLQNMPRASLLSATQLTLLAIGPAIAMLVLLLRSGRVLGRLIPARRRLQKELSAARTPSDIATAVEQFLAAHFRLADNRVRRDQTIGKLRATSQFDLALRLERFYSRCEQNVRHEDENLLESLRREAESIADEVRLPSRQRSPFGALPGRAAIWIFCAAATTPLSFAAEMQLSRSQQQALLNDAMRVGDSLNDPIDQEELDASVEQLHTLVGGGIENDRLYFALATVAHRHGELGHAVAYYRKALRLNPTEPPYRVGLERAESELNLPATDSDDSISAVLQPILHWVPAHRSAGAFWVAWFGFWIVITLRLCGIRVAWKSVSAICLVMAVAMGTLYVADVNRWVTDEAAVLIADQVTIREADGTEFESIIELTHSTGRVVALRAQRGDWMQIELPSGVIGWIHRDTAIAI